MNMDHISAVVSDEEGRVTISVTCLSCGRGMEVDSAKESYDAWAAEEMLTQEIWPELRYRTRMWLVEGVCPDCRDTSEWLKAETRRKES